MANVDIMGSAKGMFGSFNMSSVWNILSYGLLLLVVAGVVTFFVYRHLMNKRFTKTIVFWKRNAQTGAINDDRKIKAMPIRIDSYGNICYRLQTPYETRNLIPKLKLEVRKDVHYVQYCEDGRIVEFLGFTDYDDKRKSMDARFTDSNTELARSSLQQMNKERYEKSNWLKEHASLLVNIGAIVVIMVFLWLIADKLIDLVGQIGGLIDKAGELQEAQNNILTSLDNLLKGHNL